MTERCSFNDEENGMNTRRNAMRLLLGGIAACAVVPVAAASDIDVYHSPD